MCRGCALFSTTTAKATNLVNPFAYKTPFKKVGGLQYTGQHEVEGSELMAGIALEIHAKKDVRGNEVERVFCLTWMQPNENEEIPAQTVVYEGHVEGETAILSRHAGKVVLFRAESSVTPVSYTHLTLPTTPYV